MKEPINTAHFWTGIADVTSPELPSDVQGAVYRVLTYAADYESFARKVADVIPMSGDELQYVEEPESLSDFLRHDWVTEDHEIFEMMKTANRNKQDVICGDIEYYTYDDA